MGLWSLRILQVGGYSLWPAGVWCYSAGPTWGPPLPAFLFSSCAEEKLCLKESEAEYLYLFPLNSKLKYTHLLWTPCTLVPDTTSGL